MAVHGSVGGRGGGGGGRGGEGEDKGWDEEREGEDEGEGNVMKPIAHRNKMLFAADIIKDQGVVKGCVAVFARRPVLTLGISLIFRSN